MNKYCCAVETSIVIEKTVCAENAEDAKEKIYEMFSNGIKVTIDDNDIDVIDILSKEEL